MVKLQEMLEEACNNWNGLDRDAKENLKKHIFRITDIKLKNKPFKERIKIQDSLFELVTTAVQNAQNSGETDGPVFFLMESRYFCDSLFRYAQFHNDVYYLSNRSFINFYKLTEEWPYESKILIFGQFLSFLHREAQFFLLEQLKGEEAGLSFTALTDALFSGMLRYSDSISARFHREMEALSEDELSRAKKSNPAYVLSKLFIYGYIDEKELGKFEDLLFKAPLLGMCLHPETFDWDNSALRGWEMITHDRRIIKLRDRNLFCI